MLTGELLDGGGRGLTQVLGLAGIVLCALLLVALLMPAVVLTGLGYRRPMPVLIRAPGPRDDSAPTTASTAVNVARLYLGVPYVFGGTDPKVGLDCSGLVQLVFHQLGVNLPRTAQLQYNATERVDPEQLQPGDLVFFARTYDDPHDWITHVGIYIGNGLQINAPTEGEQVSVQPVFSGFWGQHFASGGRVAVVQKEAA